MQDDKNKWLARQINAAKINLNERPEWMKRAARFESSHSGSALTMTPSKPEKQIRPKKTSTKK